MSEADKRSVTTDALTTLGTIIDETQKRDAIHIAVEPVVAGQVLFPGEHIQVVNGIAKRVKVGEGLGVVDPFLTQGVSEGQMFWLLIYPRVIRSLRHVWSHPAFPDEPVVGAPGEKSPPLSVKEILTRQRERMQRQIVGAPTASVVVVPVDKETAIIEAKKRIAWIAEELGNDGYDSDISFGYDDLMCAAETWRISGERKTQHGSERWQDTFPQYAEEFWKLYEIVTGKTIPVSRIDQDGLSFFSCSC